MQDKETKDKNELIKRLQEIKWFISSGDDRAIDIYPDYETLADFVFQREQEAERRGYMESQAVVLRLMQNSHWDFEVSRLTGEISFSRELVEELKEFLKQKVDKSLTSRKEENEKQNAR